MKQFRKLTIAALLALACALAMALSSCAGIGGQDDEEAERANANRQYMAQLNSQMADLQQVADDFQVAVSEGNAVAMKAQLQKAEHIISAVEASEPTDDLADAKGLYVEALTTLDGAMKDYAELYMQVESNGVDAEEFADRVKDVQESYDEGIAKLQEADEAVEALSKG